MSSLANCFTINNIPKVVQQEIRAKAKEYRNEGFSGEEANKNAVKDYLKELEAQREDITAQIQAQLPKPIVPVKPASPKAETPIKAQERPAQAPEVLEESDEDLEFPPPEPPKPGEPARFVKTKAGEQGVMPGLPPRTQEGLGGIKSNIPAEKQIEGTPLFTKPEQQDPEFFEGNVDAVQPSIVNAPQDMKIEVPEKQDRLLKFSAAMRQDLLDAVQHNARSLQKKAGEFGIVDPTEIKEAVEHGIILYVRDFVKKGGNESDVLAQLVAAYDRQPTLSARSSQSVALQQYSTPIPISYIMQLYTGTTVGATTFEPTAGNGMLIFAADGKVTYANEIDPLRRFFLSQLTSNVLSDDATQPFDGFAGKFQSVLANPPFGGLDTPRMVDGYKVTKLEHLIAINALETMRDSGKAAILIGGHAEYDNKGRLKKDRTFMNWLYRTYNVADVINVNGDLYRKQGASFPIRVILINGRKETPEGIAPLKNDKLGATVNSFEDLYSRMKEVHDETVLRPEDIREQGGSDIIFTGGTGGREGGRGKLRGTPAEEIGTPGGESGEGGERPVGASGGTVAGGPAGQSESERGGISDIGEQSYEGPAAILPTQAPSSLPNEFDEDFGTGSEGTIRSDKPAFDLGESGLDVEYRPQSTSESVTSKVPKNMAFDTYEALARFEEENGPIDEYVRRRLGYASSEQMHEALAGEQVDGVALALGKMQIGKAFIIGDEGGLGKGRQAAGIVRYAVKQGMKPVFVTQKKHLLNDMYRDLKDIGSEHLRPFIMNADGLMKDEDGNIVHEPPPMGEHMRILKTGNLDQYDFVVMTYSQIAGIKAEAKREFVANIARNNFLILDESHSASGQSNTGEFVRALVETAKGVAFLSATYAKRVDNMALYALKSSMADANMTEDELVAAFEHRGSVALQEMVSADLAQAGDMIRRQRSFEGVNIDYKVLDKESKKHREISDKITELIRDIIDFQITHVKPAIEVLDTDAAAEGEAVAGERGVNLAGVNNAPFTSKVHNVIEQMLFAIKADSIVEEAIRVIKENKKPIIAVRNTMESFLKDLEIGVGEVLPNNDFSASLLRGLRNVMKIVTRDTMGNEKPRILEPSELGPAGAKAYRELQEKIKRTTVGMPISPIDYMLDKLTKAGYKFGEVTGREELVSYEKGQPTIGKRIERDVTNIFRKFNSGEYDGMILNAAGGTGTSAHASEKFKDQRQRVMLIHQIELDISSEVQKRYRIYRTGQVVKPEYLYVVSDIPAETRMLMVLKMKMRKLDANTTSSQKSSLTVQIEDFLNKYGDRIAVEYVKENPAFNASIMDPLQLEDKSEGELERFVTKEDAANAVARRVAWLPAAEQEEFYKEINERYKDLLSYLEEAGLSDLELKTLPLAAKTLSSRMLVAGTGKPSPFGRDSLIEEVEVNVLRKPMLKKEVDATVAKTLGGKTSPEYSTELLKKFNTWFEKYKSKRLLSLQNVADIDRKLEAMGDYMRDLLQRFRVGSPYAIPANLEDPGFDWAVGTFLGFDVSEKRDNPYLPSAVKARFAIADSRRALSIPLSRSQEMMGIEQQTNIARDLRVKQDKWDLQQGSKNRERRLMVTGNILQAVKEEEAAKGQFVNYTTVDGTVKRGILLPHTSEAKINASGSVNVPISRAKDLILKLGHAQTSDGQVLMTKQRSGDWIVEVPKTKKRGGKYFLNPKLLELTTGQFDSKGDTMRATVPSAEMSKFLDVLSEEFRQSVNLDEKNLPKQDFSGQGPVTLNMAVIPGLDPEMIKQAWKRVYGFFAYSTVELPLEDVQFADSELRHAMKVAATKSKYFAKMLTAPNWTAQKYPGFGSTYKKGKIAREGIYEIMVRRAIREYNENRRSIDIDILNEWKDLNKLSDKQWKDLLRVGQELNELFPVGYELPDATIQKQFHLDDATLKAYRQLRTAMDMAFEYKKELERYKITNGHYSVKPEDVKRFLTEEALEASGLDEDAVENVLAALKEIDQDAKMESRKMRAIWALPEVRDIVAEGLVEEIPKLFNYLPMTRPAVHQYLVLAKNPNEKEPEEGEPKYKYPPYLASFGSAEEAQKHANQLAREGYEPLLGGGRIWTFTFEGKQLKLNEEQLTEWIYKHLGPMTINEFEAKHSPSTKDHVVAFNADKDLPERVLRQLPEDMILRIAESVSVDTNNPAIKNVLDGLKAQRGWERHMIQRERAPGFQWTKENILLNAAESIDGSLRAYHKYIGMSEARSKLLDLRSQLPNGLAEFIEDWLTGFTQASAKDWHLLRQIIYVTTLGNSLTNWVQNLTQPFLTTWPWTTILLKEMGVRTPFLTERLFWDAHKYAKAWYLVKAGKVLGKDFSSFAPPKDWIDILERLRRRGVIQPLQFEEIAGFINDPRQRAVFGSPANRFVKRSWRFYADVVGLGQRFTELDNRTHAAMVALMIGTKYGNLSGNELLSYVERFVDKTQFPYGKHALPPILFQFKGNRISQWTRGILQLGVILRSFAIQFLGFWFAVLRSGSLPAILRMFTASFALAGLRSITPFNGLLTTFLTLAFWAAGDEEPYETKERRLYSKIEETLGLPKRFLTTGPLGALGKIETTRLLGIGDIIPGDPSQIPGVTTTMFQRASKALKAAGRGDVGGFMENMPGVPRQPSGYFRGRRFEREGVIGQGGKIIIPKKKLTPYDIFTTKLGFTPTNVYEAYEKNRALGRLGSYRLAQYKDFRDRYVRAIESADTEEKQQVLNDVREYNKDVQWPDRIEIPDLIISAMNEHVGAPHVDKYIQKRMEYERIYGK